jgi:hypothetical protein
MLVQTTGVVLILVEGHLDGVLRTLQYQVEVIPRVGAHRIPVPFLMLVLKGGANLKPTLPHVLPGHNSQIPKVLLVVGGDSPKIDLPLLQDGGDLLIQGHPRAGVMHQTQGVIKILDGDHQQTAQILHQYGVMPLVCVLPVSPNGVLVLVELGQPIPNKDQVGEVLIMDLGLPAAIHRLTTLLTVLGEVVHQLVLELPDNHHPPLCPNHHHRILTKLKALLQLLRVSIKIALVPGHRLSVVIKATALVGALLRHLSHHLQTSKMS